MKQSLAPLAEALGHTFTDLSLLQLAVTHRSYGNGRGSSHNERLEFLGDRVLGLVIADLLYSRFPDEAEGALARRHAALVRKESLARVAEKIGLAAFLRMSRGEEDAGGRCNAGLLADACEGVIGALYLDGGLAPAQGFIRSHWLALLEESAAPPKDAKTALQEWAQQRGLPLPEYSTLETSGPDHSPVFKIQVSVKGYPPENASGNSKRVAAQVAAQALLKRLMS